MDCFTKLKISLSSSFKNTHRIEGIKKTWAGDVAQLVVGLPRMLKSRVLSTAQQYQDGAAMHTGSPGSWKMIAEGSRVQSQPCLHDIDTVLKTTVRTIAPKKAGKFSTWSLSLSLILEFVVGNPFSR